MTNADTKQHRNRDAGLPGHPTKFAPRVGSHAGHTDLSGLAAGFDEDSLKPWDENSAYYSLVETQRVVNSSDTDVSLLREVAQSENPVVLRLLAQANVADPDAAHDVFDSLSQSGDREILRLLGQNKAVPVEILDGLTRMARVTQNEDLAHSLAMNRSASEASLDELRTHPSWEVRYEVAGNPNSSNAAVEALITDREELVSDRAINIRNERDWMASYTERTLAAANYVSVGRHNDNIELAERFATQDVTHAAALDEIAGFIPDESEPPF